MTLDKEALERLSKLAKTFPKLNGYFAPGTGGVDVLRLIEVLEDAAEDIDALQHAAFGKRPSEANLIHFIERVTARKEAFYKDVIEKL